MLGVERTSTDKEIKKAYYKLSMIHHPDKGGDQSIFSELTEAYDILSSKNRDDYDSKSRFGAEYDETLELINIDLEVDSTSSKSKYEDFKNNEIINIELEVDENFDGSIEYERWVMCKDCSGLGRDTKSRIVIKGPDGKEKFFDAVDGCDFCEGTGKNHKGDPCPFCAGAGVSGGAVCLKCSGNKRILGKQKLKNITFSGETHRIDAMGHASAVYPGKSGYLLLFRK